MGLVAELQVTKRNRILSATVEAVTELGYEGIRMRELAERCGVTVPTLYNQFGGKDQLIARALEDAIGIEKRMVSARGLEPGYDRLIELIELNAVSLIEGGVRGRRIVRSYTSLAWNEQTRNKNAEYLTTLLKECLLVMVAKRQLAKWLDPALLAEQMTAANIRTSIEWSLENLSTRQALPQMRYAMGIVVLGGVRGLTADKLIDWLKTAQRAIREQSKKNSKPKQKVRY